MQPVLLPLTHKHTYNYIHNCIVNSICCEALKWSCTSIENKFFDSNQAPGKQPIVVEYLFGLVLGRFCHVPCNKQLSSVFLLHPPLTACKPKAAAILAATARHQRHTHTHIHSPWHPQAHTPTHRCVNFMTNASTTNEVQENCSCGSSFLGSEPTTQPLPLWLQCICAVLCGSFRLNLCGSRPMWNFYEWNYVKFDFQLFILVEEAFAEFQDSWGWPWIGRHLIWAHLCVVCGGSQT